MLQAVELGCDRFPPFYPCGVSCQSKRTDPAGNEYRALTAVLAFDPKRFGHDFLCSVHQWAREGRYPAARASASEQNSSSARV